jgi:hypothetical protein
MKFMMMTPALPVSAGQYHVLARSPRSRQSRGKGPGLAWPVARRGRSAVWLCRYPRYDCLCIPEPGLGHRAGGRGNRDRTSGTGQPEAVGVAFEVAQPDFYLGQGVENDGQLGLRLVHLPDAGVEVLAVVGGQAFAQSLDGCRGRGWINTEPDAGLALLKKGDARQAVARSGRARINHPPNTTLAR